MDREKLNKQILKYYKSDAFMLELPSKSSFRHYRGKNIKGGWIKCPRKISKPEQLKKWIIKNKLIDVYYSTSQWLNPVNIAEKSDKDILIKHDLVFDVDESFSKKGINKALLTARKIFMVVSPQYELKMFCFTGMKGFRLIFTDIIDLPKDYRKRVNFIIQNRKIYIDKHLSKYTFDKDCTTDPYRIVRVLNTAHSNTGLVCTELHKSALFTDLDSVLKTIKNASGKKGVESFALCERSPKRALKHKKSAIKTKKYDKIFITNQITKNRFVPFLKYSIQRGCKRELKRLHKTYDIGPLWLFKDEDFVYVCGIRTFQKRRLNKMYNASNSLLKNQFKKYHRNYFQVDPELKFVEKMNLETESYCSRAHYNYILSRVKETQMRANVKFHKDTILKLTKVKYKD